MSDNVTDDMAGAKYHITRKCKICGAEFRAKTLASIYCSRRCSDTAYKRRKREKEREQKYREVVKSIPETRYYISVHEAVAMFAVGRTTLYRMVRNGEIPAINIGKRLFRIDKRILEQEYQLRHSDLSMNEKPIGRLYRMEIDDCYSIGEISDKFGISPTTVYSAIRKYSIPIRQIGKYVYAPKEDIDKLFS